MSTNGSPQNLADVEQTLTLTLRATRRRIAPVMRTPGGEWESDGKAGSFAVPLAGGMVIEIDGQAGEWWVSATDILEAVLAALAAEQESTAAASCQAEGGHHGA